MSALRRLRRMAFVLAIAGSVAAQENPHVMTLPDGSTDAGKCAYCHNDDLSLSRSQVETCTFCHAETLHSGAAEHARASAAAVALALKGRDTPAMPLTNDGRMYCGTCHLFHDPAVMGEALLETARAPRTSALNRAVRGSVEARGERESGEAQVEFLAHGTRFLRLPTDDDGLCKHCHGGY
jgi:hypothetical protein